MGIRDAAPAYLELGGTLACRHPLNSRSGSPFPDERWRMIDQVDEMDLDGGPHGLGVVRQHAGRPGGWFFAAHFHDDPVWPGSLGLESMLQLMKVMAVERWGSDPGSAFESPGSRQAHRGPTAARSFRPITASACRPRSKRATTSCAGLLADGHLEVDGKIIYQMHDFALGLCGS